MTTTLHQLMLDDCGDQTAGQARKQKRHLLLRERRALYVRRGQRALLARLLAAETATADDVYESVELPPSIAPRCLGAVPASLVRAGIIRSLGYVKSARPERHASPIQVWTLANQSEAVAWLAANPDLSDLLLDNDLPLFAANEKRPMGTTAGRETKFFSTKERT